MRSLKEWWRIGRHKDDNYINTKKIINSIKGDMMKVIQSQPKSRPSRAQPVAVAPPVQQHRGRMIAVIVFAIVLLAAIILFIAYGKQIAGKAIAIAPESLVAGQAGVAGVSLSAGSSMTINKPDYFDVYANFPAGKDANGFDFRVSYDSTLIQFLAPSSLNENALLSGVIIMDNSVQVIDATHSVLHISGTTIEMAPTPTHSLRVLAEKTEVKNSALIPLAHLQFLALKSSASAKLTFDYIMIPDVTDNTNVVSSSSDYVNAEFKIETVSLCGNGNIDAGEQCDGANLNSQTCTSLGSGAPSTDGAVFCNLDCTFNTGDCISGAVTPTQIFGDVDADGSLSITDALCYNKLAVAPQDPCRKVSLEVADLNCDGAANTVESGYVQQALAGNPKPYDLNNNNVLDCKEIICSQSTLGACTTLAQCKEKFGLWNNGVCVQECPAGMEADYKTVTCVAAKPICSYSNPDACTTQSQCKSVGLLWNNGVCVKDCPAGTDPSYGTMTCVVKTSLLGDVNGDGVVNVQDIQKLINHITGLNLLSTTEESAGNTNCDSVINVQDIQKMINLITTGTAIPMCSG